MFGEKSVLDEKFSESSTEVGSSSNPKAGLVWFSQTSKPNPIHSKIVKIEHNGDNFA